MMRIVIIIEYCCAIVQVHTLLRSDGDHLSTLFAVLQRVNRSNVHLRRVSFTMLQASQLFIVEQHLMRILRHASDHLLVDHWLDSRHATLFGGEGRLGAQ